MTNELLHEVACPNCLNPIDIREHGRHVTCDACSSQFILRGHLCPNCSTYSEKEEPICGHCGSALTRICRKCRTSNWAGDEYCVQCGQAMDILDMIANQTAMNTADRLLNQRQQARQLKEIEELASNQRMEEMMAQEQIRLTEIHRRLAIQKKQERKLFILMGLGIFCFILVLILYGIFSLM
jgi:hypothetical protein